MGKHTCSSVPTVSPGVLTTSRIGRSQDHQCMVVLCGRVNEKVNQSETPSFNPAL